MIPPFLYSAEYHLLKFLFLFLFPRLAFQSLEEELNRRQSDIRQLTEAAGKLKEQQVLEYQALISSLTIRWQDLQRQFVDFQTKETSALAADLSDDMGGPDFVTRVNKLREAIASVSRQMHSPPLNLKHYEQLSGQEDSIKVCILEVPRFPDTFHVFLSPFDLL